MVDEGRDMWKVYLDLKVYAAALANCRDPLQRDQVYLVQVILDVIFKLIGIGFHVIGVISTNPFIIVLLLSPAYRYFSERISLLIICGLGIFCCRQKLHSPTRNICEQHHSTPK